MNESPNFGPYSRWESVGAFSTLSETAFATFDKFINENWALLSRPIHHLFLRMAYQAKTTSLATRLNNSWAMCLPAFALTRVRLEQTIICSYLIHEDGSIGLRRFVAFIPIGHYKASRIAMEDSSLATHLSHIDLHAMQNEAVKGQEEFRPGFSLENDKFERKWTNLDLRSLAKKRDDLVNVSSFAFKHSLEREYVTIYTQASSIVHSDCSSPSYSFLNIFASPAGVPVLMAVPAWATIVSAATAHYDILQCYEILKWLGIAAGSEYDMQMNQWIAARDQYIP